jgi:hydroxyethylthiazole kinase-like uncharacterized protein yjeF
MPLSSTTGNLAAAPALAPVCRVDELRAIEARHTNAALMEHAGDAAADVARAMHDGRGGRVVVLAGPGNNGGDAFVVARRLRAGFHDVATVFPGDAARLPPDAAAAYASFADAGGVTTREPPAGSCALIVDGLFGIGLKRPAAAEYASLIDWANRIGAPILALDVPSGLDADTGAAFAPAVRATRTATFIALKPGLLTGDGVDLCGAISIHPLDIDVGRESQSAGYRLDWPALAAALPEALRRGSRNVHKGTFGTLSIIGGAEGMSGAPILAGRAAMQLGAGKTWVGFVSRERPRFDPHAPELMLRDAGDVLDRCDALVVGPGLGDSDAARDLLRRAIATTAPLVLDADALNLIARDADLRAGVRARHGSTLATPHPTEASRLLGCDTAAINADRLAAATALAHDLRASIVLKGAGSVLAYADDGFDINASGGPALATAGSGDVLAGMVGALLAQGLAPKSALRYAVCLHGAAADALVAQGTGPVGVVASELPAAARALVNQAAARSRLS